MNLSEFYWFESVLQKVNKAVFRLSTLETGKDKSPGQIGIATPK